MAPIWTLPKTWAVGEIVTADTMNTHLRDNFDYLKARVETALIAAGAREAAGMSTASTQFTDMNANTLRLTLTTTGGPLMLGLCGSFAHTLAGGEAIFTLALDGANIGDATYGLQVCNAGAAGAYAAFGWHGLYPASAGTHTVAARWRTGGGTLSAAFTTSLYVVELK